MKKETLDALVDRFLSWPLPDSVCSDGCATQRDYGVAQGWPKRSGTNLLTSDEARQMLEHVLQSEIAHSHWIPVNERMPERYTDCIVAFQMAPGRKPSVCHDTISWSGDFWRVGHGDVRYTGEVTHWMPLPEAPK